MRLNSNIKGFPLYHVTKDGKVYNIRRNSEVTIHPHYRTGRNIVHLYSNGKRYNLKVYRLVALAYIPNPENKPCVCHKDNNKSNDWVENLYWGTYKENSQQMVMDDKTKLRALVKTWGISQRSMNRYIHKIKTGYYEA